MAEGVMEEFELAKSGSKILIPIPCSGHAAAKIWQEMKPELGTLFSETDVKSEFDVLKNGGSADDQIVEAIFSILKKGRRE